MKTAFLFIGKAYQNLLSLIYESRHLDCDRLVVRYAHSVGGGRECYLLMKPEQYSRYVSKYVYVAGPEETIQWDRIKAAIDECVHFGEYDRIIVLPTDDAFFKLLNEHKHEFTDEYVFNGIGINGRDDSGWFSRKSEQKRVAIECGVPVACGGVVSLDKPSPECTFRGDFPCIVKINQSITCYTKTKGIVGRCKDIEELRVVLSQAKNWGLSEVLVEELLPIDFECCLTGACCNGAVLAIGGYREVLMCSGPRTGNSITGYVVDVDADQEFSRFSDKIKNLLGKVKYNGQFHVDVAYAHGHYYLIEINLRLGALSFSIASAGADVLGSYLNCLRGGVARVEKPKKFGEMVLNERALIEELGDCAMSLGAFFRILRSCQVRKIRCLDDPGPYRYFRRRMIFPMLISIFKWFLPVAILIKRKLKGRHV